MESDLVRKAFSMSTDKQQTFSMVTGDCISGRAEKNFSSERMLHKDYYCRNSVGKKSGRGSQGA
jgi:hypothetical protein